MTMQIPPRDVEAEVAQIAAWQQEGLYPPCEAITHRNIPKTGGEYCQYEQWRSSALPKHTDDQDLYEKRLNEALAAQKAELARDEARYKQLESDGSAALSDYDIRCCNDNDRIRALKQALMLVGNHVSYHKTNIYLIEEELQLQKATAGYQAALF